MENKSHIKIAAFLFTSGLGISFLVFLNAAQPFVLRQITRTPNDEVAKVSSTLIFCDELLALVMVLLWGRVADKFSPRLVTGFANIIIALALVLSVQVKTAYPGLLLTRLLFSVGASGITTMLSANLSLLSSSRSKQKERRPSIPDEDQPLLGWRRPPPPSGTTGLTKLLAKKPAALSAFLGISAGIGALFGVFVLLRIPTWYGSASNNGGAGEASVRGLKAAFRITGGIALLNAVVAFIALPSEMPKSLTHPAEQGFLAYVRHEIGAILKGFRLARKNANVALGCAGGFAARAQTISVSAFIPLYVASYYFKQGKCDPSSPEELKQSCHEAYALASAISGATQLVALLSGIIFIWVTSLSRTLAITSLLGCISFALLGRSAFSSSVFGGEDPKNVGTWIAAIGIGIAQTGSVTISLALIAKEREKLKGFVVGVLDDEEEDVVEEGEGAGEECVEDASQNGEAAALNNFEETAGALAGAYSFCGGLGVLSVSAFAGILSSRGPPASPFLGIAAIDLLLGVAALAISMRTGKR